MRSSLWPDGKPGKLLSKVGSSKPNGQSNFKILVQNLLKIMILVRNVFKNNQKWRWKLKHTNKPKIKHFQNFQFFRPERFRPLFDTIRWIPITKIFEIISGEEQFECLTESLKFEERMSLKNACHFSKMTCLLQKPKIIFDWKSRTLNEFD